VLVGVGDHGRGRVESGDRNVAADEAVPKPHVPGHLLRQLMEQPRRLPSASGGVGDRTPVTTSAQLQQQTNPQQAKVANDYKDPAGSVSARSGARGLTVRSAWMGGPAAAREDSHAGGAAAQDP